MSNLKKNLTLKDIQKYVVVVENERGFKDTTILQNCLQLGEEVGELFKAIRRYEKIKIDQSSKIFNIDDEIADILIFLCSIANRYEIDLEVALREKEKKNKTRVWEEVE